MSDMVALALEGLVPIVWMERVTYRCEDPRRPKLKEVVATDPEEHEQLLRVITTADTLAVGQRTPPGQPNRLAAVAKALVILAAQPGGVLFLDTRYVVEEVDGVAQLKTRRERRTSWPPR